MTWPKWEGRAEPSDSGDSGDSDYVDPLIELEAAEATLQRLNDQAEQAKVVRAEREVRRVQNFRRQHTADAQGAARAAVDERNAGVEQWQVKFRQWVHEGHILSGELTGIERVLLDALRAMTASVRAGLGRAADQGQQILMATDVERIANDALKTIGAFDMPDPFGEKAGNQFAREAQAFMKAMVGPGFVPKFGASQFQKRRLGGP